MELDADTIELLCRKHDVTRLRLFGSAARGSDVADSDIDLLVEFARRKSLVELVGIEQEFSDALGRKVDLVTPAALSPYIRERKDFESRVTNGTIQGDLSLAVDLGLGERCRGSLRRGGRDTQSQIIGGESRVVC